MFIIQIFGFLNYVYVCDKNTYLKNILPPESKNSSVSLCNVFTVFSGFHKNQHIEEETYLDYSTFQLQFSVGITFTHPLPSY